ncbi:MAG: hypothetical protein K1X89_13760 [Myxococcaceae bacterium]|nr:hypothetical protein [Myxococcaceae bacterium]
MAAADLLVKLRNAADGAPLHQLATLSLDALLDQPVGVLLPQASFETLLRAGLEGWLRTPESLTALTALVDDAAKLLSVHQKSLGQLVDPEVQALTRALLKRPYSPDKQLVLTVIDRPPVRELVRGLLLQTVLDFARRASAPVAGMAKGLGGLARMAADTAKARTGTLGALVGAVTGEVERQVEKRAADVVDAALAGVFGEIADAVSDPKRAHEAAELRLAIYDGVLELTLPKLSRELVNLDVPGGAQLVREGLEAYLATPRAAQVFEYVAKSLHEREGKKTLRQVLTEAGALQAVRGEGLNLLRGWMQQVVATDSFAAWLDAL